MFVCAASLEPSAAVLGSGTIFSAVPAMHRGIGAAAGITGNRAALWGPGHAFSDGTGAVAAAAGSSLAHLGGGHRLGGSDYTEDMDAAAFTADLMAARLISADIVDDDQDGDSDLQVVLAAIASYELEEAQFQAALAASQPSPSSAFDAPSAAAAATTSLGDVIDLTVPDGTEPFADMASKPRMAPARGSKSAPVTIYIDWDDEPPGVAMAMRDSGSSSSPEVIDLTGTNAAPSLAAKRKEPEAPTMDAEHPARAHATCPSGSVSNKP